MTPTTTTIDEEANALGVKKSDVKMAGFKDKDPTKIATEEARNEKLVQQRTKNRIEKAKKEAKMKPIDKRKAVLVGRFKAVRARKRANTYSNKNVEAWTEEFNMIKNNPKGWIEATKNGTVPFSPGNKRKKTAKELLDSMDLD